MIFDHRFLYCFCQFATFSFNRIKLFVFSRRREGKVRAPPNSAWWYLAPLRISKTFRIWRRVALRGTLKICETNAARRITLMPSEHLEQKQIRPNWVFDRAFNYHKAIKLVRIAQGIIQRGPFILPKFVYENQFLGSTSPLMHHW